MKFSLTRLTLATLRTINSSLGLRIFEWIMSEISIGQIVGWGSDMPYCEHVTCEGRVTARHGEFLVILNENLLASIPHAMPFVIRRADNVWLVEGYDDCPSPVIATADAGATIQ